MALTAIVLGAAAGGGFPQWNCRCAPCRLAWAGDPRVRPRSQASIAVSADRRHWILVNASPDLRTQILATPALHPSEGVRHSPIAAVILTGAEIDQAAGLLNLRESHPFAIYGTETTLDAIAENPIFAALAPGVVQRCPIAPGEALALAGLEIELFLVPGKPPLYLEDDETESGEETSFNVGVSFRAGGKALNIVPGAAAVTPAMRERFARCDALLFDGTLFSDDEMIRSRAGRKTGRRMGHMPIDGGEGSLEALAQLSCRRIYVHINNTNPMLIDGSPERRRVEQAGFEIAEDGMEIVL